MGLGCVGKNVKVGNFGEGIRHAGIRTDRFSVTYVAHSVGRRRAFTTTRSPTGPEEVAAGVVGVAAMRRVAVTGLGVVAPNGVGKDAFWSACVNGTSGVGPIRSFDASHHPVQVAGEVHDFDPGPYLPEKARKALK